MIRVGLTGGIGSGKSVVSRLFAIMGAPIYDSDSRAKYLMVHSDELKRNIISIFGSESYCNGVLNRTHIAKSAFSDKELLCALNNCVHPAVAQDFRRWCSEMELCGYPYIVMESAILFESGFDKEVDQIVCVIAPEELRIERVMGRDCVDIESVKARIESQMSDFDRVDKSDYVVANDEVKLIVPQVVMLNSKFREVL